MVVGTPPMDLGLSSIIYQKIRYLAPKKGECPNKCTQIKWQLSVGGLIIFTGIVIYGGVGYFFYKNSGSIMGLFMGPIDYFLNALVKIVGAFGAAVGDLVPGVPDIPDPASVADKLLGMIGL